MSPTAVVIAVLVGAVISQSHAQQVCHSNDPNPYRLYSSWTRYENVQAGQSFPGETLPGCQPVSLFMLVRNGIRTPDLDELNEFETRLRPLRQRILQSRSSQLCSQDLAGIQDWQLLVNSSTTDLLTKTGEDEVKLLAQRFQRKYPSLLSRRYSDQEFVIRHAYRPNRANAATAFAEGLGFNATVARGPTPQERDLLLQFAANCKNDDDDDLDDDEELEDYMELQQVQDMIAGITARLGLPPASLSLDDIDAMYKICAYDYALTKQSPWCAAFTASDLQLLELKEDLISAEKYGYDDDINQKETCILLKDFVGRLDDIRSQTNQLPPAVMYFAKTETFLPFLTSLGLFEDEEDLEIEDDGIQSLINRKWRMSLINPFMSNLAIVLYSCPATSSQFRIRALVNEVPAIIPPCETTICPLERLLEKIEDFAEDCSYEELCDGVSATTVSYSIISIMATLSVLYSCLFS